MVDNETLRAIGPHEGVWQIAPTPDVVEDSDLVSEPVSFVEGKHTLQFHGGPVIQKPKLVLIWCGKPAIDRVRFERFCYELVAFGYLTALTYAGVGNGEWWGSFDGPALQPGQTLLDSQAQQLLRGVLAQNSAIPQPDGSTIYSLMLPSGVISQFDGSDQKSCTAYCGYHSNMDNGHILYSVQIAPDCSGCNQGDVFNGAAMVEAHEVCETASDPTGQGWYEDSSGMENSDQTAWVPLAYGPWTVQGYGTPDGRNAIGTYTPVATPNPQPQPGPKPVDKAAILLEISRSKTAASKEYDRLAGAIGKLLP